MLIVKKDGGVWLHNDVVLRLHVDDRDQPIRELRRLVERGRRATRPHAALGVRPPFQIRTHGVEGRRSQP